MDRGSSSTNDLTVSVTSVVESPVDLSFSNRAHNASISTVYKIHELGTTTPILRQSSKQPLDFYHDQLKQPHRRSGKHPKKRDKTISFGTKSVAPLDQTFLDFIGKVETEEIFKFSKEANIMIQSTTMERDKLCKQEQQKRRHNLKMSRPFKKPVESFSLEHEHSAGQVTGRIFYCKLCSLESTRARAHTFLTLEEGVKHLQNHWRPPKQQRGPPIRRNKVPPELYYKKQALNIEEDITLLAKLYLGFKVQEQKPYRCGLCGEGFSTTSNRYHHVEGEHVEASAPLLCCGAAFQNRDKYIQHMFFKHCELRRQTDKESLFICELCFVAFYNRTDLEWHFYRHNQHVANPTGDEGDGHFSPRSQFFRCTLCSEQCILSRRKPPVLYTLSESFSHLGWHWLYQIPPEIRQNPVLMFEDDADVIHKLYMEAVGIREWRCGLCPLQLDKEHVLNYHSEGRRAFRCEGVTCKNTLQFAKLEDFVGHIFMQHTQVLKLEEVFLCLICNRKFENRNKMKWHCYIHNVAKQVAS